VAQRFGGIVVDLAKVRDYCLSESHPCGRHKARVFRSRLGLTAGNAEWLRQALLNAAANEADQLRPGEMRSARDISSIFRWQPPAETQRFDPPGLSSMAMTCYD
jgi:hypothetical protein